MHVGQRVVNELISEQPFPPSISDIQQRARKVAPDMRENEARAKTFREGVDFLVRFHHMTREDAQEAVGKELAAIDRVNEWAAKDPDDPNRPQFKTLAEWDRYMGFVE